MTAGQIPVVTAAPARATAKVELTLGNEGKEAIVYTLTPNEYEGSTRTVTVKSGGAKTVELADRSVRLLRRGDHRQHHRRLPPPVRGPDRLSAQRRQRLLDHPVMHNDGVIEELIDRMAALLESLQAAGDQRRYFHATYQRTTIAVADRIRDGGFDDAGWVERWDVAFADLYLDALQAALAGRRPARPWEAAFGAPAELPPLRHVLLGMNAHVNYDLPQALLAVITDEEFADPVLLARRKADHRAIDDVLAARVGAEGDELAAISGRPPGSTGCCGRPASAPPGDSCARRGRRSGPTPSP